MSETKKGKPRCDREDCCHWTNPRRYSNSCTALTEVTENCPFYKTRNEMFAQREEQQRRMRADEEYRKLCERYGVRLLGRKKK